jgi:predicted PurR-regulated permease PerM
MAFGAALQSAQSARAADESREMTMETSDLRDPPARPRSSRPLLALVCGLCGVLLYFAQSVFIPIALALLIALVLSSPVEALHRQGLPRSVSAILILVIFFGLTGAAVDRLWEPAQQWLAGAPRTAKIIEQKLGPVARVLRRIDAVTDRAEHLTDAGVGTSAAAAKPAPTTSASEGLLLETRSALVAMLTITILTLFLLAGGPPMLARMTASLARDVHSTHILKVIEAVRSEVARYYATIAVINLGLALATGVAMMALGMPNPVLWGALAGVLNFIPYVGSAATLVVLVIVAFVSFDGAGHVLAVGATYLGLATIEGQIVQPLLVGHRLDLSPIIVFLALWFGGWFWGIAGIVLAVPSLVALKVVAEHSKHGTPMVAFLSPSMAKRFHRLRERTNQSARARKPQ